MTDAPLIMIVAGEASGDLIGASLIHSLKQRFPLARFEGIAGPQMQAAGCKSLFPLETLSVMGIIDVVKRLPQILNIRHRLIHYIKQQRPVIYIGIDAPDFNLPIEYKAKKLGIKTVHYVSPSVWAWRQGRIHKIAKSIDLMLTLFPFEAEFYHQHKVAAVCVGHPFADEIPLDNNKIAARQQLGIPVDVPVIAILPGSREGEIEKLGRIFLQSAKLCKSELESLHFVTPMVNQQREQQFKQQIADIAPDLPIKIIPNNARAAMIAADSILLASGTATLEAMLCKRNMVVAYLMAPLAFALAKRIIKVKHIALPNLLNNERLVPELLQDEVNPENIAKHLLLQLKQPTQFETALTKFYQTHQDLRRNASERAAEAIAALIP